jgi:hypothetical protein
MSSSYVWLSWSGAFAGTGVVARCGSDQAAAATVLGLIGNQRARQLSRKSGFLVPQNDDRPGKRLLSGAICSI